MADIWPSPTDKIMDNYSMNSSAFSTVTAPSPPTTLPRRSAAQVVRNSHEGQDELDESPGAVPPKKRNFKRLILSVSIFLERPTPVRPKRPAPSNSRAFRLYAFLTAVACV